MFSGKRPHSSFINTAWGAIVKQDELIDVFKIRTGMVDELQRYLNNEPLKYAIIRNEYELFA